MPLTCYVGNYSPKNGTSVLQLEKSEDGKVRELVLGGDPLDLTDDEFASLCGRFQLRKMKLNADGDVVEDDGEDDHASNVLNVQSTAPSAPSSPSPATPSASVSSTPTTPGSGS